LRDFGARSCSTQPLPADSPHRLKDEVQELELECRKAELTLNLQNTRAAALAVELAAMETEETLRRNKRRAHDDLEQESAEKRRQLKKPCTDNIAKDSGTDMIKRSPLKRVRKEDDDALNPTTNTTGAATEKVSVDGPQNMDSTYMCDDVGTTSSEAVALEVAAVEAASAGAASAQGAEEGSASAGAETQEGDDAHNEEMEEEGAALEE